MPQQFEPDEAFYKILIVVDDEGVRDLLNGYFTSKGNICVTAADGREALNTYGKGRFDVIITDIKMPDMDGISLTKRLHQADPDIPVMVMTGFAAEYTETDAIHAGASEFITKPFSINEFTARFIRMMRDHRNILEMRNKHDEIQAILEKSSEIIEGLKRESEEKISMLKHEIDKLRDIAHFDTLTGLPNRVMFFDRLVQALETAKRYDHIIALFFVDLDLFKEINDTMGHAAGDLLLKEVGLRIAHCIRKSDTAARFGGDEFTIILTHVVDLQEIEIVARRIIESLSSSYYLRGEKVSVGVSIGITLYPQDGDDAEALIKRADAAMYEAKRQGGNTYCFFTESKK